MFFDKISVNLLQNYVPSANLGVRHNSLSPLTTCFDVSKIYFSSEAANSTFFNQFEGKLDFWFLSALNSTLSSPAKNSGLANFYFGTSSRGVAKNYAENRQL